MLRSLIISLLSLFFSIFTFNSLAQKGPQISVMGGGHTTWMLNTADFDEGKFLNFQSTFGSQYGIKAAYFFSESVGLEAGFLRAVQGQQYEHTIETFTGEETFESQRTLIYNKIPVLLHLRSAPENAAYFSAMIGPQFSFLSSFSQSTERFGNIWGDRADYEDNTVDMILGFGPGFSISDALKVDLHFRFSYAFTDAENKSSDHWDNGWWDDERPVTNNATGGLQLGITYGFGG